MLSGFFYLSLLLILTNNIIIMTKKTENILAWTIFGVYYAFKQLKQRSGTWAFVNGMAMGTQLILILFLIEHFKLI